MAPKLVLVRSKPPDDDDEQLAAWDSAASRWSGVAFAGMVGAQTAFVVGSVVSTGALDASPENCDSSVFK